MDGEVGGEWGQMLDGTQAEGVRGGDKGSEVNPGKPAQRNRCCGGQRMEMKQRKWRLRVYANGRCFLSADLFNFKIFLSTNAVRQKCYLLLFIQMSLGSNKCH